MKNKPKILTEDTA